MRKMDSSIFLTMLSSLKKEPFTDGKVSVLRSYTQYQFTAAQTVTVIGCFPHAGDKTKALTTIAPQLVTLTGIEGKSIIEAFTFSSGKIEALELIASHVNDPANKYVIVDAFTFHTDKKQARDILDKVVVAPPPPCNAGAAGYYQQQPPPVAVGVGAYGYQPPPQVYPPPQPQDYQPPPQAYPPPAPPQAYPQGYNLPPQQGYPPQQHPAPPPPQAGGGSGVQYGFGIRVGGFPTVQAGFDVASGVPVTSQQPPPPGGYPPPQGSFQSGWP